VVEFWWRWRELVTNKFLPEIFLDPDSAVAKPHASVFQFPTKAKLFAFSISTNKNRPTKMVELIFVIVEMARIELASELGCECESTVRRTFFGLK
jgi:hypothetical protein